MKKVIIGFLIIIGVQAFSQEVYLDEKDSICKAISSKYNNLDARLKAYHECELAYEAKEARDKELNVNKTDSKQTGNIQPTLPKIFSLSSSTTYVNGRHDEESWMITFSQDRVNLKSKKTNKSFKIIGSVYDNKLEQFHYKLGDQDGKYIRDLLVSCRKTSIYGKPALTISNYYYLHLRTLDNKEEYSFSDAILKDSVSASTQSNGVYKFNEYYDNGKKMITGIDVPSGVTVTVTNDSLIFSRQIVRSTTTLRFKVSNKIEEKQLGLNKIWIMIPLNNNNMYIQVKIEEVVRASAGMDLNELDKALKNKDFVHRLSLEYENY